VPRARCLDRALRKRASRADLLAVAAAEEALADAGLPRGAIDLAGAGLVLGAGAGGLFETEGYYFDRLDRGLRRARVSRAWGFSPATTTDLLGAHLGFEGFSTTVMTACSSSTIAIGLAADAIRSGDCDVVLTGGSDALSRLTFSGFCSLRAVDPDACRPFDRNRRGMSLGEGAGILVLEDMDRARSRGARIRAELLGYGAACDAHHVTAPDPSGDGASRTMRAALDDAGLSADAIDYISAHGTATQYNDEAETRAIHRLFGARARSIPVSSIKSMVGPLPRGGRRDRGGGARPHGREGDPAADRRAARPRSRLRPRLRPGSRPRLAGARGAVEQLRLRREQRRHRDRPRRGMTVALRRAAMRIAITGVGAVTPFGEGAEALWKGLVSGVSRIRPIERFDTSGMRSHLGAVVGPHDPRRVIPSSALRRLDPNSRFSILAAAEALEGAGIVARERTGIVLGTNSAGIQPVAEFLATIHTGGGRAAPPILFPYTVANAPASQCALHLGLRGPNLTIIQKEGSSCGAVATASRILASGGADALIAGGADDLARPIFEAWERLGVLSRDRRASGGPPEGCRPYDVARDGIVLGEGACFLTLEREGSARDRGARALAFVEGSALGRRRSRLTASRATRLRWRARCAARSRRRVRHPGTSTPCSPRLPGVPVSMRSRRPPCAPRSRAPLPRPSRCAAPSASPARRLRLGGRSLLRARRGDPAGDGGSRPSRPRARDRRARRGAADPHAARPRHRLRERRRRGRARHRGGLSRGLAASPGGRQRRIIPRRSIVPDDRR
jgi:3-oxoacyl-[acyl-carrier-protein] synthase II